MPGEAQSRHQVGAEMVSLRQQYIQVLEARMEWLKELVAKKWLIAPQTAGVKEEPLEAGALLLHAQQQQNSTSEPEEASVVGGSKRKAPEEGVAPQLSARKAQVATVGSAPF